MMLNRKNLLNRNNFQNKRNFIISKKLLCCALAMSLLLSSLTGCGAAGRSEGADSGTVTLRIANCEEYIDEGDWDEEEAFTLENGTEIYGENALYDDFADWYEENYGVKVEVEYSTYGTNEDLYNSLTLGSVFDLVCPSEYMIMKLMEEGRLQALSEDFKDSSIETNYYAKGVSPYIDEELNSLTRGDEKVSKYAAAYMWGTMGLVYNPDKVTEADMDHWSMLLDKKYAKQVNMKDSVRDSYFIGLSILNEEKFLSTDFLSDPNYHDNLSAALNDTTSETIDKVEDILSQMRSNAYSMETDSGKADMVSGKVVANMQWSGDAVYTMDQAEEDGYTLNYAVPEEDTNIWFDGWVMLKSGIQEDSRKQQVAEAFLNYISRPDNVVRNMYYIGYTSAISGGDDDSIYDYVKYCYEAEDESEAVDYPLGYFFSGDNQDKRYILKADSEQLERQLFAQYPPEDVIDRAAVMACYTDQANKEINAMWIDIRCFDPFE